MSAPLIGGTPCVPTEPVSAPMPPPGWVADLDPVQREMVSRVAGLLDDLDVLIDTDPVFDAASEVRRKVRELRSVLMLAP